MPERDETDGVDQIIGPGRKFVEHIWPLIGNELPSEVHERILGPLDRLGDPEERAEESIRRARRMPSRRSYRARAASHSADRIPSRC